MTGLGGKARTVPNPNLQTAPEPASEAAPATAGPENLLHNVRFHCFCYFRSIFIR
jgi:hypothetical protein